MREFEKSGRYESGRSGRYETGKTGRYRAEKRERHGKGRLSASFTAEAAAIMGITLLVLASFILLCLRLHDQVLAKNALVCSIEVYSHRDPEGEDAQEYQEIAEDTGIYILKGGQQVRLEAGSLEGCIRGSVSSGGNTWTRENQHLRAQRWLRFSTLADFREVTFEKRTEAAKKKTAETEE